MIFFIIILAQRQVISSRLSDRSTKSHWPGLALGSTLSDLSRASYGCMELYSEIHKSNEFWKLSEEWHIWKSSIGTALSPEAPRRYLSFLEQTGMIHRANRLFEFPSWVKMCSGCMNSQFNHGSMIRARKSFRYNASKAAKGCTFF